MRGFLFTLFFVCLLFVSPSSSYASSWDLDNSGAVDIYDFSHVIHQFAIEIGFTQLASFLPQFDLTSPTTTPAISPTAGPLGNEIKIVDQTFKFTHADNGFHVYKQHGEYIPGVPHDWTQPDDYYNGEWHFRYEILSPPNQAPGKIQTCIWNMPGYKPENCSMQVPFDGVGVFTASHIPRDWWKHSGVPLDFSDHKSFLIRAVLRGPNGCNVTRYNVEKPCWDQWPKYENTQFRVSIVMVPAGKSFSGWHNYP